MADWAGGQCSPSVLPFTEYSGVRPSVMSNVRKTRNSSASYSKNSSVASVGAEAQFVSVSLKSLGGLPSRFINLVMPRVGMCTEE